MKTFEQQKKLEEAYKNASEQAKLMQWDLWDMRFLTTHPDDDYLFVTWAKRENKFVVWLWNDSTKGFHEGYYTDSEDLALEKYFTKR